MRSINKKILLVATLLVSTSLGAGAAESSAESTALVVFQKCIQQGQDLTEYGKCTKVFFAEEITQKQRKRLLAWFLSNPDLEVKVCAERQQSRAARKVPDKEMKFLCVRAKTAHENENDAVLVFKKIKEQPRLLNLSQ